MQCGFHGVANDRAPLRLDRERLREHLSGVAGAGRSTVLNAGQAVIEQMVISEDMPAEVLRLYTAGRLWVDGLVDPLREVVSTRLAWTVTPIHEEILTEAYDEAVRAREPGAAFVSSCRHRLSVT